MTATSESLTLADVLRSANFIVLSAAIFVSACGDDEPGVCIGQETTVPVEAVTHFPVGSAIEWSTNPPVTGSHFEHWGKWDRHYTSLDRGFWVHNLEHGGVVLLYNCPDGCSDIVESLIDVVRQFPTDPIRPDPPNPFANCTAPVRNRLLVASDPLLPKDVRVAAVAWGKSYTASCFNSAEIASFISENYEQPTQGVEDVCADGLLDTVGGEFIDPPN